MHINRKLFLRLSFFIFIFIITDISSDDDYGFFYDNYKEEISFNEEKTQLTNYAYKEKDLLISSNKQNEYYSLAKKNKFKIEHYLISIYSLSSSPIYLYRVSFNITEPEPSTVKEIILDLSGTTEKKLVFPKSFKNDFSIGQNKKASNEGRKIRNVKIYDTFGFSVNSENNINFKIAKLLLVNYKDNKLNYLANLSGNVQKTFDNINNTFDIYLEDMPENFDLYITLEIYDNNWKNTEENILIVQKDFNYPNYCLEDNNPNKKLFILTIIFIAIAFILIIIFSLVKIVIK